MTETASARGQTSAPPSVVWRLLGEDFFGLATWATAIGHSSAMTATPPGMGASRRVQAGGAVLLENVVDWAPESALAYEIVGLPPVVRGVENRWELEADGSGTSITLTCAVEPGPKPPMVVAAKAVARRIAKTNESLVADLIARAELEAAS